MDYAERVRAELRVRCVRLKTKSSFLPLPGPGDAENPYPSPCWWCEQTGMGLGPDGSFADPAGCDDARTRPCYEPPVRL
jgi:hypothetical protein